MAAGLMHSQQPQIQEVQVYLFDFPKTEKVRQSSKQGSPIQPRRVETVLIWVSFVNVNGVGINQFWRILGNFFTLRGVVVVEVARGTAVVIIAFVFITQKFVMTLRLRAL